VFGSDFQLNAKNSSKPAHIHSSRVENDVTLFFCQKPAQKSVAGAVTTCSGAHRGNLRGKSFLTARSTKGWPRDFDGTKAHPRRSSAASKHSLRA